MKNIKTTIALAAMAGMLLVSSAKAVIVTYTVSGLGPIAFGPDDSLTLSPGAGLVTVTAGGPAQIGVINGVTFTLNNDATGSFSQTLTRTITVSLSLGSETLTQNSTVTITQTGGFTSTALLVMTGSPVVFNLGAQSLIVTPLQFSGSTQAPTSNTPGSITGPVLATFQLTAVPEPSTVVAGALLLLPFGLSALRAVRKDKSNTTVA